MHSAATSAATTASAVMKMSVHCRRSGKVTGQTRLGQPLSVKSLGEANYSGRQLPTKIPLPVVGRKDLVFIHLDPAQNGAFDYRLVEHRRGFALAIRPRPRLPCPPVPRSGRSANDAVYDRPPARQGMPIDNGAVDTQHGIDPPKPLHGRAIT